MRGFSLLRAPGHRTLPWEPPRSSIFHEEPEFARGGGGQDAPAEGAACVQGEGHGAAEGRAEGVGGWGSGGREAWQARIGRELGCHVEPLGCYK